ncbi:MAG: hypothetical protein JWP13_557 [Candidatus Saccharibacteria bacterium]|nr:hypothetical protein [Candidatus Saccharibacteria bacterium]
MQLREYQRTVRLSKPRAARLEAIIARSYTDDADVRRGALSAPRTRYRPGLRDDAISCVPASMLTIV